MTRRFLDNVRADISALLVTAGETPAPSLAELLIDTIDSSIADEAAIASNTPSLNVPTSTTWQSLTSGIYDIAIGGDLDFLIVDASLGSITLSATAGFTYEMQGYLSFSDLNQNTPIELSILVNGLTVGFIAALTGGGGTRPRTANFSSLLLSAGANDVITIGVQTPAGVNDIDITSIGLLVEIRPTNNA